MIYMSYVLHGNLVYSRCGMDCVLEDYCEMDNNHSQSLLLTVI